MTNEQLELLKSLYLAFSPTRREKEVAEIVQNELSKMLIPFSTQKLQTYRFVRGQPIFAAHMDQVGTYRLKELYIHRNCIFGDGNLGADDKNGVWILLQVLKKFPNISFIFSTGEESGFEIDEVLEKHKEELEDISYGLVFDRRNSGDIVGWFNNYCNKDFETDIEDLGKQYGYEPAHGTLSDCDQLSRFKIPCVNLSCGYYNPHTEDEFTDLNELENALNFAYSILSTLTKTYLRVEHHNVYSSYGYGYGYGYGYNEYGFLDDSTWEQKSYQSHITGSIDRSSSFDKHTSEWEQNYIEFKDWGFLAEEKKDPNIDNIPCNSCSSTDCKNCKSLDDWYYRDKNSTTNRCCSYCSSPLDEGTEVYVRGVLVCVCPVCETINDNLESKNRYSADDYDLCKICGGYTQHINGECSICYGIEDYIIKEL